MEVKLTGRVVEFPAAFAKLHDLEKLHYWIGEETVDNVFLYPVGSSPEDGVDFGVVYAMKADKLLDRVIKGDFILSHIHMPLAIP
jgi:hypothetical protein